jgi:aryl-alcohol dehydrogenase-like predicted oxidoreductase
MDNKVVTLGFGCASIMGRIDKKSSLKALDFAYEHGIRYFDTARSYGWGDGEKFLGEFLKTKQREDYAVTTKCGLLPQARSNFKSSIRALGRKMISSIPVSRKLVQGIASNYVRPSSSFDLSSLAESFHTSLRELDIEYVDTLLLHNFTLNCNNVNEILDLFTGFCKEGKLKKIGVSTEGDRLNDKLNLIDANFLNEQFILQIPATVNLGLEEKYNSVNKIIHSLFRPGSEVTSKLDSIDPVRDPTTSLFQYYAESIQPSVIVCSMFNLENIKKNISAIEALKDLDY